jgi:hypothetical protein
MMKVSMNNEGKIEAETIRYRDAFAKGYTIHDIMPVSRNETLEEVAKEFDRMTSLGDTAASFAAFARFYCAALHPPLRRCVLPFVNAPGN